ncbi:hypothetical protein [Halovivax cerinus]|uniref:Uncharacterized protein n=1 Tax=Halovivax cerinus TaxID=1487865 RepID=A0ABD5NMX6_9EURY|nr:hypothetical protein [Halovivax cerinus]
MIGTAPALIFDSFPWWVARPILYALFLGTGMALDETYVNRTTILAGSLAVAVHSVTAGGLWLPLSLYLDVGLVIGLYGLYAYVVDGYVPGWFRLLAYMLYSPLSVALVLLLPDVVFIVALVVAGYANVQLLAALHPVEPYYFGPDTPEAFARSASESGSPDPVERTDAAPGAGLGRAIAESSLFGGNAADGNDPDTHSPGGEEADDGGAHRGDPPSDRGVLPGFMRRI